MKNKISILLVIIILGCKQNNSQMTILKTREEAIIFVDKYFSDESETLIIADELLDPMGMNMAIIADGILKKGYMPNGFEQKDGYRIYKYIKE